MKKGYDIIVVGDANVDIIVKGINGKPTMGKEVLCRDFTTTVGGSASIFAYNASRLGSKVAMVGKIGRDHNGDFLLRQLESANVDITHLVQLDEFNTGATLVMEGEEDRANVTYTGAMEHLSMDDVPLDIFMNASHLHVSGVFFLRALKPHLVDLFGYAKGAGLTTSLDPQSDPSNEWDLELDKLLSYVDIFLPNEAELKALTGYSDINLGLKSLNGLVKCVIVKRGAKGSLMYANGSIIEHQAYLSDALVDTVGAGDNFDAGFVHSFLNNTPLADCQDFGNLCGAISTTRAGGVGALESYRETIDFGKKHFGYKHNVMDTKS